MRASPNQPSCDCFAETVACGNREIPDGRPERFSVLQSEEQQRFIEYR